MRVIALCHQFGVRLKQLRAQGKISQRDLEEAISLRPGAVSQYERGRREPGFDMLVCMADLFDASVDYMLGLPGAPRESHALTAARQLLQETLRQARPDPCEQPAQRRVATVLLLAQQVAPELFALPRLARQTRIPSGVLRLAVEGANPMPEHYIHDLATYLGLTPDWLLCQPARVPSV